MSDDYVCVPHRIVNCPIPTCEDQFNAPYKEVESLKQQVEKLHACLSRLFNAAPSLGHHEVRDYDCPARQLARAMNEAAKLLRLPIRYPNVDEKIPTTGAVNDPPREHEKELKCSCSCHVPAPGVNCNCCSVKPVCEKCGGDHLPALTCQERSGRYER